MLQLVEGLVRVRHPAEGSERNLEARVELGE